MNFKYDKPECPHTHIKMHSQTHIPDTVLRGVCVCVWGGIKAAADPGPSNSTLAADDSVHEKIRASEPARGWP